MARTSTTHALRAPVAHARADRDARVGDQWIGVCELADTDAAEIGISIRHADGTCVVAALDTMLLDDFANQLAILLERRSAGRIEPHFPVHQ